MQWKWKKVQGLEKMTDGDYTQKYFHIYVQCVPGVKVTTSGFNSRADSEPKIYTRVQFATVQEL
jgi:hypothetical protein